MTSTELEPLDVLIVEDDSDTRANLCDILELDGHHCSTAASCREALSALASSEPSVIILDRQLPDGNAESLIPQVLGCKPDLPIVVVTGFPNIESAINALRLGAYDYLLKPINPDALRHSLRRIAERRQYVNMLRQQRDFAEGVIQTAQAIVLVLDPQARIVRYNKFTEELSGVRLDEVVGQDWFSTFLLPEDRGWVKQVFAKAVQGEPIRNNVNSIKTRRGTPAIISWSSTGLYDTHGRLHSILSIGHDITDLRQAQQQLVQNERLAAIGEMVTGLAHESRNAFQRSQACLEMLALDLEQQPESLQLVDKIQKALDHLKFLYEEVRSYAAPINLRYESLDVTELLNETWLHLETAWSGHDVKFELQVDPNSPRLVNVDRRQLQQVFRNLLENAIDACQQSGTIEARLAGKGKQKSWLQIEIHDSGSGIDPDRREQIFEPFFTTKTRGTGLGMAISKRIVEAHGGTIQADQSDLNGACFVLTIPLAPRSPSNRAPHGK